MSDILSVFANRKLHKNYCLFYYVESTKNTTDNDKWTKKVRAIFIVVNRLIKMNMLSLNYGKCRFTFLRLLKFLVATSFRVQK